MNVPVTLVQAQAVEVIFVLFVTLLVDVPVPLLKRSLERISSSLWSRSSIFPSRCLLRSWR